MLARRACVSLRICECRSQRLWVDCRQDQMIRRCSPEPGPCPPRARKESHPRRTTAIHGATSMALDLCSRRSSGCVHLLTGLSLSRGPPGRTPGHACQAHRSRWLTGQAVAGLHRAAFLATRLSSSRPPRLGRSLQSRRMRSATPTRWPLTWRLAPIEEDGDGPGHGPGVQLPVHPWLVATRRTPILDRLVGVMICTPAPAGRAEGRIARIACPGPGAIEGTTFGSSPAWLPWYH